MKELGLSVDDKKKIEIILDNLKQHKEDIKVYTKSGLKMFSKT